jgi:hypothetical protein
VDHGGLHHRAAHDERPVRADLERAASGDVDALPAGAVLPIQRPAPAGWLPTLKLAPGQFADLEARFGGKALCELTIEGTLEKLQVSGELPTNLELTGVKIVDARC